MPCNQYGEHICYALAYNTDVPETIVCNEQGPHVGLLTVGAAHRRAVEAEIRATLPSCALPNNVLCRNTPGGGGLSRWSAASNVANVFAVRRLRV